MTSRFAATALLWVVAAACATGGRPASPATSEPTYWAYVAAESADLLHLIRFGPEGASVEKTIPVGEYEVETEGPHGLRVSPDGEYLFLTTGHGIPDGKFWRIKTGADTVSGEPIFLGFFPATIDVSPDGLFAFVANFNLHGEPVPSSVSVVYTPTVTEVAQTTTCVMPHGGRMHPDGSRFYSACMMDDQIVEIDTRTFDVTRRFRVAKGHEGPLGEPETKGSRPSGGMAEMSADSRCSPTWVQPAPSGEVLYVACNAGDVIHEVQTDEWKVARQFTTGRGPYNLAVTPDGRTLIATLKQGAAVEFFDLASGESRAVSRSTTTVTHGVEVTPDSRYAFVSVEGVGAEPGKVDIYDVATARLVASVAVGQQAGGIAFWKMND